MGENPDSIISIFHQIKADLPGKSNSLGVLILFRKDNVLHFSWREYSQKSANSENKTEIRVSLENIQKIMINYQTNEEYLLISTINPSNMYQFIFPKSMTSQLITVIQTLTLYQHGRLTERATIEKQLDFVVDSFITNENHYRLYDINVENGKIQVHPDFSITGFESQSLCVVKPDLHIISRFNVKASDYTQNPLCEEELKQINNLRTLKDIALKRGIHPNARYKAWPLLFGILPFDESAQKEILKSRTEEYLTIKSQWQTMSKTQLKYLPIVKDAFATIRVDVKRTHPTEEIPGWDQTLISVLRTFVMWNLDVRYTQGLNDIALNFLSVFLPLSGTAYTPDEAEALMFWCFAGFVELVSSGLIADNMMEMQERELTRIMAIISHFHPGCADWLRANGLDSLSFLIASFILAYGRSFATPTVARIWEALVSAEAPWLFLRYFSASLVILSSPSFQAIPNCSSGKLVALMDQIFYNMDVGAVIGVAMMMMAVSPTEVAAEMAKRPRRDRDAQKTIRAEWADGRFDAALAKFPSLFK